MLPCLNPVETAKEWWDLTAKGQARSFEGEVPSPFKRTPTPLEAIPGWSVGSIKTDFLHAFNLGFGGDMAASSILLLVRMKLIFIGRSAPKRFESAYESFYTWCVANKKTTSIKRFNAQKFKVTQTPATYVETTANFSCCFAEYV